MEDNKNKQAMRLLAEIVVETIEEMFDQRIEPQTYTLSFIEAQRYIDTYPKN